MYIVLEGGDGSGKNEQADRLAQFLTNRGRTVLRVDEPDSSLPTGQLLRQMLKDGSYVKAHVAMFLADRMAMQSTKVQPHLEAGGDVVSVRSFISTLVYQREQGYPLSWLLDIHRQLLCKATHVVLLDLDPEVALQRANRRPGHMEFYEMVDIQKRNRQRYLDVLPLLPPFLEDPKRIGVIEATGTREEVATRIQTWLGAL